jgi:hypothetical protein
MASGCREPRSGAAAERTVSPPAIADNVTFASYAGSAACTPCHADVIAAWEHSPMHEMTRNARGAVVRAPFADATWMFKGDRVVFEEHDGERWVTIHRPGGEPDTYRITRIIGGRTREDFVGTTDGDTEERVVPVSYVFATASFRYKGYSVMAHERDDLRPGPVWRKTCIFCHNTVPEIDRLLGAIAPARYQSEQVDRWLSDERRMRVRVVDDGTFESVVASEAARLGTPFHPPDGGARAVAKAGIDAVRSAFDGPSLVEVGIGCEACHGGAAAHARDPRVKPALLAQASWLRVDLPKPTRAEEINRLCARCHQVVFSRYPFTWEGGTRNGLAGGSHINSGEGRDFLLGGCSTALACTDCHDPHSGGTRTAPHDVDGNSNANANATCTRCHAEFADRGRLAAHSHHDPGGAGGSCIACHMPRKNMGLDGVLTRYHRIGSPTDAARVLGDRPLECALCHSDKTVGALLDAMQAWWPVRYPTQRLVDLYGSLDANVIRATLDRGKPHEQAVAIATLGEAHAKDAVPQIAAQLLNEYPLVRQWALRALVAIRGHCEVDLSAADEMIARQAQTCGAGVVGPPQGARIEEEPED